MTGLKEAMMPSEEKEVLLNGIVTPDGEVPLKAGDYPSASHKILSYQDPFA